MTNNTSIGSTLFKWRDYTPIPLIIIVLITANPNIYSVTIGMLLIFLGELIRIYSVSFIGTLSRTRNTKTVGAKLVTTGPFSWVRNPLYVGNFFIVFGLSVYASTIWVIIVAAALFCGQYYFIVQHEEDLLKEQFPDDYEGYMKAVPAWLPKKIPNISEWEWPTSFTPAFKSEKRTLSAIIAMIIVILIT